MHEMSNPLEPDEFAEMWKENAAFNTLATFFPQHASSGLKPTCYQGFGRDLLNRLPSLLCVYKG
ncbi:hypothetical protein PIB30_034297 [Stylosanthes scabra]|uniref:Uncharacterized protein n=1 Tax=Stylosanthes scabra TaxID=79078 RepID=A0ABU6QE28_9FABA|nr:hypothetical protein [Stylosanthes scabra]